MKNRMSKSMNKQKGTILFISLIILIVLTVMGLASMQDSIIQEKMTAAIRDSQVAHEGAEAGLIYIEQNVVETLTSTAAFDDTGCLYQQTNAPRQNDDGTWPADLWSSAKSCVADGINTRSGDDTGKSGSLASPPRYFVTLVGKLESLNNDDLTVGDYASTPDDTVTGFRIVIRSVGSSETAQKFLLGFYGKQVD